MHTLTTRELFNKLEEFKDDALLTETVAGFIAARGLGRSFNEFSQQSKQVSKKIASLSLLHPEALYTIIDQCFTLHFQIMARNAIKDTQHHLVDNVNLIVRRTLGL